MEKRLCSCGGEAEIVHWTSEFCCVCCSRCGAKTAWFEYETDAINAWNEQKGINNGKQENKI